MSSARSQSSPSVSLFPFLAVLMCTMGALILLLIVTSRRIRREAVARSLPHVGVPAPVARIGIRKNSDPSGGSAGILANSATVRRKPVHQRKPAPKPVDPQLPQLRPIVKAPAETDRIVAEFRAGVIKANAKRKAELARLRSELEAIQSRRDELSRQLAAALQRRDASNEELKRLQASQVALAQSADDGAGKIAELKAAIRAQGTVINGLRRKLALLKLKQAQASSKYSIVPFDGSTGTTRRPIFIECTKESIRFLPEGVEITAADLLGFTPDNNPLLAAAQRLLHYWIAKARTSGNPNEPEPYVLLLVRPSGSVAYYAARRMLSSLDRSVGYELIEADWDLHLPPVDPQARAVCELAVNQSLGRRRALPRGSLALLDGRRQTASQFGNSSRRPSSSGIEPFGGVNARVMRFNRATGRFEVIQHEDRAPLGPFGGVVDGDGKSETTAPQTTAAGRQGTPSATATGNPSAQRSEVGDRRSERVQKPHRPPTSDLRSPTSTGNATANPGGTANSNSASAGTNGHAGDAAQEHLWPLNRKGPAGSPDGVEDATAAGNSKDGTRPRQSTATGSPGDVDDARRQAPNAPSWMEAGSGRRQHAQAGGGATPGFGLFGNSGGRPNRFASLHRWGLSSPDATIGFEREIDIVVTSDRLVVRNKQTIRVGKGETRDELVKRVATAIEREVRSWGKPPDSFYWVPTLKFVISPGGNRHYERLAGPVKKLGLHAIVEYRLETPPDASIRK
jgi:hypothetical protein